MFFAICLYIGFYNYPNIELMIFHQYLIGAERWLIDIGSKKRPLVVPVTIPPARDIGCVWSP